MNLQTSNLSYYIGKKVFSNDGFQNMFDYQPIFNMLELKKEKGADYIIDWKSKGMYTSKLKPLYTAFLKITKNSGIMGIKLDTYPLSDEQNN